MTSLIFGAVYLTHQAVVGHRHEKKRVKNYERWEGLRDEYDEQRQIQRASRSLDIQRTGQQPWDDQDKPILTLRDQQEANDARTSWRPQEAWNDKPVPQRPRQSLDASASYSYEPTQHTRPQEHRSISLANGYNANNNSSPALAPQPTGYHGVGPMRPTPTGAAWDDGLPRPLAVQRKNFEEQTQANSRGVSRSTSLRQASSRGSSVHHLPSSNDTSPPQANSSLHGEEKNINNPFEAGNRFDSAGQKLPSPTPQQQSSVAPGNNPFEAGNRFDQQQQQPPPPPVLPQQNFSSFNAAGQPFSNNPFEAGNRFDQPPSRGGSFDQGTRSSSGGGNNPFEGFAQGVPGGGLAPVKEMKTPAGERDMMEWWK